MNKNYELSKKKLKKNEHLNNNCPRTNSYVNANHNIITSNSSSQDMHFTDSLLEKNKNLVGSAKKNVNSFLKQKTTVDYDNIANPGKMTGKNSFASKNNYDPKLNLQTDRYYQQKNHNSQKGIFHQQKPDYASYEITV